MQIIAIKNSLRAQTQFENAFMNVLGAFQH